MSRCHKAWQARKKEKHKPCNLMASGTCVGRLFISSTMCVGILAVVLASVMIPSCLCLQDESALLLSLKASVDDPSGTLSTWNPGIDVCRWNGVACDAEGNVSGLKLQNITLPESSIATAIHGLPLLRKLSVSGSSFRDSIATNLSTACFLEEITLSGNQNMTLVDLGRVVNSCKELKVLNVSNNQAASGELFPLVTIGNALEAMDLSHNMLSGGLSPSLFSSCNNMRHIDVSHNNLSGQLPEALVENCTTLEKLSLAYNSFEGSSFPVIKSLSSLEFLDASFNNFSGPIPDIHPKLKHLNLSSNRFTTASKNICVLVSRLESLIVVNNNLTGRIWDKLMNCSKLMMLDLSFNSLSDEIPNDICNNLPRLQHFLAWGNTIQGKLPSSLGSCANLTQIILSFNQLTGSIPWDMLFELKKLEWVTLSNNKLSGELPHSFELADHLFVLQACNNSLEGNIPEKVGIETVDLRRNNLSGTIHPATFDHYAGRKHIKTNVLGTSLKLAAGTSTCKCIDNIFLFQGIVINQLEKLLKDRSGGCGCTLGFLPASFYDYYSSSPSFIDISYNRLVGEIPGEIGTMQDIRYLSFAHNSLSGTIPVELGQLKEIIGMDLSYNKLQGGIPGSFVQLSSLSGLNVSYNNLSGPIPQGGQFETLESSSYTGNVGLCGRPLSPCDQVSAANGGGSNNDDEKVLLVVSFGFGLLGFILSFATVIFIDCKKLYVERACLKMLLIKE